MLNRGRCFKLGWRASDWVHLDWGQTCRITVNHSDISFKIPHKQWNWCGRSTGHTHPHSFTENLGGRIETSPQMKSNQVWLYEKLCFACRTLENTVVLAIECVSLQKWHPRVLLPKCVIMAAAEVRIRLMCVRCYLSSRSSSSSRRERDRTRASDQHNERDLVCQLGQLLL